MSRKFLVKVRQRLEDKRLAARALLQKEYGNMTAQLGVAAAFELSWVELDQEAQQLGRLLSLFASVPFNWKLVEQCLPDANEEDLEDIRDGYLLKFNLLQLTSQHTYRIHPLVREFLQTKLAQLESALQLKQSFAGVMAAISKECMAGGIASNISETTREDIELVKDVIPHLAEVAENLIAAVSDEDLIWVFTGLARFYNKQGLYPLAEPWSKLCVSKIKSRLGENHPLVAQSLNDLALLYQYQGRYEEAEPLYIEALELRKQLLGENHHDVAISLNNLAELYCDQGKYKAAEPLHLQSLELKKRLLGENHHDVAMSLNNLAHLYYYQGKYKEAEPLWIQALELRKRLLGENHYDFATSLNNLAILYELQGRYEEAEPLHLQSLELRKRLLGENHHDVGTSLNNLAAFYELQGRYEEAEPFYIQALELRRGFLGENHPHTAQVLNNLAVFASAPFNWQLVEQCLPDSDEEDLEEIRDGYLLKFNLLQLAPQNTYRIHPLVREFLQAKLAQLESALQLKQAFAGVMVAIGRKIPQTPTSSDIELVKNAIPHLGEVAENLTVAISDEDLIWVFTGLGRFYSGQGLYTLAEPWSEQCVSALKVRLGDDHPSVAISLNNLAVLYHSQGRYSEAEHLYEQALEMRKGLFEGDHPSVASSLSNLAFLYSRQGRYSEVEPLYEQALEMLETRLGMDHRNTVTV